MEKSTVYFTDFRCPVGTSQLVKLKKLCVAAGIKDIDMDGKFVAIKMHFGELGNLAFLRPNYAKVIADLCKEQGGMPFLTDCNTLYPGTRKNALDNIAFVNELSKIFNLMHIDTQAVLEAAATKWNFLSFRPGLVGGHCIGVDPYYLAQKAQEYGYHPEIILAGRRLNDSMGEYVAKQTLKCMIRKGQCIKGSKVLVLGITFKENCPDVRNTKVVDIIAALKEFDLEVDVYDPWASPEEVRKVYGLEMKNTLPAEKYEAVVLAVAHQVFRSLQLRELCKENGIVYDVKSVAGEAVEGRL